VTTQTERRAADARRAAAEAAAERDGNDEAAFKRQRAQVRGLTNARRVATPQEIRGEQSQDPTSGRRSYHTFGYFTTYERGYPMWDDFGPYVEMTMRGSGADTLASRPDLGFLVNHRGVTMARTKTGTLKLREDSHGGYHDAWLNPERRDVADLIIAIEDRDIDEMSFAFMIPDGKGLWADDFTTFQIHAYDLERGDVSAVNNGANPYTDIAGGAGEVLRSLDRLPAAARREAAARLGVAELSAQTQARERIVVGAQWKVDPTASQHVRNLQWRKANTARRYAELAAETGMSVPELLNVQLPWFEVVNAAPELTDPDADGDNDLIGDTDSDATDVLIYDEIGGSFGVSADAFAQALADITTPRINLRINSPGGSVVDAIAIASSIRHKRDDGTRIVAYTDGLVASAATIIAIAADEVVSMPGGEWMFHFASTTIDGNKVEAGKMQTFLDFQDRNIADMYALKSGTQAEWLDLMAAETWMTGAEAQDAGVVDRVWNSATKQRGERVATDPRLIRRWSDLPYVYQSRADAPVTQNRRVTSRVQIIERSIVEDGHDANGRKLFKDVGERLDEAKTSGSTPSVPQGRSIARIAAEFAAEGVTDLLE
jgi:HK97 family phage prohead protease